ncbi:MAG: N-acetyltransferase [Bacteroidales bacterium]
MGITIREVKSQRDLKIFAKFSNKLYKTNKFYVPQLIMAEINTLSKSKNPAFDFCEAKYWLALDNSNRVVGRVAAIINHKYNEKTGVRYVRFGWLDFVEDQEVLKALLQAVESWASEKNGAYIHGPLGFSDFDVSGILIEGFDELATAYGKYNHPYYPKFIEQLGYKKEVDWVEYNVLVPQAMPERFSQMAKVIGERYKLSCAKFTSTKELLKYSNQVFTLLNKEYENIHGFSELTLKQIEELKKQFIPLLRLKYVSVVMDSEDKVVGFGICLPSLSKALQKGGGKLFPFGFLYIKKALRYNETLDTLLIAIESSYKDKGVNALIFSDLGRSIIESEITNIETTRELENNFKVKNLWSRLEHRLHKRARCYIKKL